jgi:hypothetical protein
MHVLSEFVKLLFIKAGNVMKNERARGERPFEGYLIVGAALALLLGVALLKARAS